MEQPSVHCVFCDRPITGEVRTLGGRSYDAEHYARAARDRRSAVIPILIEIGAVVIWSALIAVLAGVMRPAFSPGGLVLVGIVLALVPAAIWLLAFYQQDRLEPEPKHYIFGIFLLGAVLAEALARPLIRDLFEVQNWLYDSALTGILGSIFVVGFIQEFLKYAGVRYTVFHSPEFDERIDGIIYGAAIGLGFATMLNVRYVVDNNGVDLAVGAIQVAVTALAHASFSGVVGYFLGRAKFERMGPVWLQLGVSLAAVLNGIVSYALREIPELGGGFSYNPWYGLVFAAIVAGATFVLLFMIIRRINAATLAAVRAR
jgi:RsiW-degrading membrane proteinase PrsW (M82 family)